MSDQMMSRSAPVARAHGGRDESGGLTGWLKRMNQGAGGDEDDLAYGQIVIVAARWILVTAGLVLALWRRLQRRPAGA